MQRSGKRQYTHQEWVALKAYYKYRCVRCSRKESAEHKLTQDHVIPTTMGGSAGIDNIQPLCYECNQWKSSNIVKNGKILDWRGRKFKN